MTSKFTRYLLPAAALLFSLNAAALNILLTNDDGLTSNIKALYIALKADGHDVIVSAPCQGQSGMGGAIKFLKPLGPLTQNCLNNAAMIGAPGAGPVTKSEEAYNYADFHYVDGTPLMATAYGLDILAPERWLKGPDLVISGPNEGRNTGPFINSSGTVSNVQFAAARGVPAIAFSGGMNSRGQPDDEGNIAANPVSVVIASQSAKFVKRLAKQGGGVWVPVDMPLNVNLPDDVTEETPWVLTRIGTFSDFDIRFVGDLSKDPVATSFGISQSYPGISLAMGEKSPRDSELNDEAFVALTRIAVSPMQVSFGPGSEVGHWLTDLLSEMERRE